MLRSTPYINPPMTGGIGTGAGTGSDLSIRPGAPGADPNQNKDARSGQKDAAMPVFTGAGDRVELSPAARQLAQLNPNASDSDAQGEGAGPVESTRANIAPEDSVVVADASGRGSSASNEIDEDDTADNTSGTTSSATRDESMPPEEQQEVQELKQRDQEVRTHEAAHAAVGGQFAGAPTLEYETGPDGTRYAVSGEVSIDLSKAKGDPQETITKMEQVQAAALAPAQPSAQDRRVAARAAQIATQARMDLRMEQSVATTAQEVAASAASSIPEGGADKNGQQSPRVSTPEVSIESLRWSGAVA